MQIELTFLRSKIARRIFGLFIISTLVPVGFLAFFSYGQINTLTRESVQKNLRQEAKRYGGALYTRLSFLDNILIQIAEAPQNITDIKTIPKQFSSYFLGLALVKSRHPKTDMLWGDRFEPPSLSDLERNFLDSGKTLLFLKRNSNRPTQAYMLRTVKPADSEPYTLIAHVKHDFLWGAPDEFDLRLRFCIFNEAGSSLFCSEPNLEKKLDLVLAHHERTGVFQDEDTLFINAWTLYLKPHYFLPKLTIVFSQVKLEALAPLSLFKTVFSGVIIFSMLVAVFISVYTIRRNMKPLESLMDGIDRIAHDNFKQPVPVTSHDEFGSLAISFNSMSSRISKQLSVLNALAEIDRLILTRLKIEDILTVIMTRTHKVISSDLISVALVNKDNEDCLDTYTSDSNSQSEIVQNQFQLSQKEITTLSVSWLFQTTEKDKYQLSEYLQPLIKCGANCFLILPIIINKKLSAILSLGFFKDPLLSDTDIASARDYTDRIAVALSNASWEETLYYQAHYDVLTGLPNRQLLDDRLQQALLQMKRENSLTAMFFIDLDQFKSVNDSFGHTVGDQLLKEIAQRIHISIREGDSVARMGGDEFIVLLPNITRDSAASSYVALIAKKLLDLIAEPMVLNGHDIRISASIGIVMSPDDGLDMETLIKNSDIAMYHAKDLGKGNYQFYSEKLNTSTLERLLLESDLIGALDREEFELYYQSKVVASTGKIVGAEALIRWNHPTKGLVPPFDFIPVVETTSLIIPLGKWIIRSACFQNKKWQDQGDGHIQVAVNVAVKQLLHPGFVENVAETLRVSKLDSRWLELEITESAAMDDMEGTIAVLHDLKALGVSLSIDDYGTGFSSLQYMKDFPVDVLKIDQSFIFNLLDNYQDRAIVQSTINLAHNFGLKVIAEGVETEKHQKYLAELGCDELQGYFFSRPVPVEKFVLLLRNLHS